MQHDTRNGRRSGRSANVAGTTAPDPPSLINADLPQAPGTVLDRLGDGPTNLGVDRVADEADGAVVEPEQIVLTVLPTALATRRRWRTSEQPAQLRPCFFGVSSRMRSGSNLGFGGLPLMRLAARTRTTAYWCPWVNLLGSSLNTSASQRATGKSRLIAPVPKFSTSRDLRAKLKLTSGCKEVDA
jgi:hypothetical protein